MPNHIKNRLTIGSRSAEIMEFLKGNDRAIDFNKIVPRPESLDIESNGDLSPLENQFCQRTFFKVALDELRSRNPDESRVKNFLQGVENYIKYGHATWYSWNIANWGTKWNAYEVVAKSENVIEFETAWSGVTDLMAKLSEKFPEVEFEYRYADEDTGCNCASGTIISGMSNMVHPENGTVAAYELAFDLRPDDRKNYELKNGKYTYREDDE